MLFNSHIFLFAFLPVVLLGFYALGETGRVRLTGAWLILCSLFFYAWWNPRFLPLIIASILCNYALGVGIGETRAAGDYVLAKRLLAFGVFTNLATLAWFKYARFFGENLATLFGAHWQPPHVLLPLAISFFTFTQIAYLVDAFHGRTRAYDLAHYGLFVSFFPHLIAGPIVLYSSLMPQFAARDTYSFRPEHFARGLSLFVCGLSKKVLLADSLAPVADGVFEHAARHDFPSGLAAWTGALAYTFQLYFDFSGYSDMAIGLACLFNVRFPLNFNSPYKAIDAIDFWRRWHITLSTFLRDHLYIPLGGNRKGPSRRYINLLLTMVLGGLWHGAGWTFLVWGALHGAYLCVNHAWIAMTRQMEWAQRPFARFGGQAVTFLAVVAAWVFFRSPSTAVAWELLRGMAGARGWTGYLPMTAEQGAMLILAAALAFFAPNSQELFQGALPPKPTDPPAPLWKPSRLQASWASALFVLCVLHLSRISEFLYFQF